MKNHVLRPLWAAIGFVALILIARHFMVPKDFGINGRNFTYGFFRLGSIDDWKAFPVKYQGSENCFDCHSENAEALAASKHHNIQCENCHGPALNHPDDPETLPINRSRDLCLRCHTYLPYPNSLRSKLPGIDPAEHNPGIECAECHNPHKPNLEDM